jgi:uncharacterized membrane protein
MYVKNEAGEFVEVPLTTDETGVPTAFIYSESIERRHAGPLPSPDTLNGYDQLYKGAAAKFIDEHFADKQHNREIEQQLVSNEKWGVIRGQAASFLLMGGAIAGCVTCAMTEHTAPALVLGSAPVLTALGRFLGITRSHEKTETSGDEDS